MCSPQASTPSRRRDPLFGYLSVGPRIYAGGRSALALRERVSTLITRFSAGNAKASFAPVAWESRSLNVSRRSEQELQECQSWVNWTASEGRGVITLPRRVQRSLGFNSQSCDTPPLPIATHFRSCCSIAAIAQNKAACHSRS
jgi:hypothetical protein